jgi:DNA polymerase-3 subunit gamma/tau
MENFIVSARKYRPITFSSVVGQNSITTTLKNAIRNNKLAQAFLFCGPRGVGKTTCARILAKTINCTNVSEDFEPCNECESCRSFNENASFHIYELDAASNNSVDDIRNLVEQVRIPPPIGKYKVYIIDEVHMLSAAAFNAFLKTLEEPPDYAKFILATTEKHKIIPTILSRCQIFDFKRMYIPDIISHLKHVAAQEGVTYEDGALHIIAQKADGAMRDALSIFDQVVNYCGNHLEYKKVIENLNVLDYEYYFELTDALLEGNSSKVLLTLNRVIESGFDGQYFIVGLGEHLRNLLICRTPETIQLMEVSEDLKKRYLIQMQQCSPAFLLKTLDLNNECDLNYKTSANKRLLLELTLLKMAALLHPFEGERQNIPAPAQKEQQPAPPITPEKSIVEMPVKQDGQQQQTVYKQPEADKKDEVKEEMNPPLKKNTGKIPLTGVSIKNPVTSSKDTSEINRPILDAPFTQEQLEKAWEEMANSMKTEGMKIAFKARKPQLKENFEILFEVDNKVLVEQIKENIDPLKNYLAKRLKNNQLMITTIVAAQEKKAYVPYTDAEKVQDMKKRNLDLEGFVNDLGLQV